MRIPPEELDFFDRALARLLAQLAGNLCPLTISVETSKMSNGAQ